MAKNPIQRTIENVSDAIEQFFSPRQTTSVIDMTPTDGKQTCLEKYGIRLRAEHLEQNEWRKDLVYSRPLVLEEYLIQREFPIESSDSTVEEQRQQEDDYNANMERKQRDKEMKQFYKDTYGDDWKSHWKAYKKSQKEDSRATLEAENAAYDAEAKVRKYNLKKEREQQKEQIALEKAEYNEAKKKAREAKRQQKGNNGNKDDVYH